MRIALFFALLAASSLSQPASSQTAQADLADVAAARALFDENLAAIKQHDRDRYLATYLHSEQLARSGPTGVSAGYDAFAKNAGAQWPDAIEASDIQLVRLRPGLVYGTYRYRVRYGSDEHSGVSERLFVSTSDGWRIAVTGAVDTPPGTPAPPRAITGATLVDGRGGPPVANANVIIRNGKIDCAGTAAQCPVPEGVDVMNAAGMWLAPGLIDAHVHFSQTGWADGRPDALDVRKLHPYEETIAGLAAHPERFARSYLCSGVTSVWDVGGYAWTLGLAERFEHDTAAPHVAAAGPLLSTLDHWLNLPAERQFLLLKDEESAKSGVAYLAARGAKAVKVWFIVQPPALTVETLEPAVTAAGIEAHRAGLPLIVHATGLAEAKAALRAKANVLVHSVEDVEIDREFLNLAKENGTIVIPTLTVIDGYVRMYRGVVDRKAPTVDDPNHCVDAKTLAHVAETATLDASLVDAKRAAAREERAKRFNTITGSTWRGSSPPGSPSPPAPTPVIR